MAGPKGRKTAAGKLPACASCGSLERHRIVRAMWEHLVEDELLRWKALQFSRDPSVNEKWFESLEISIYQKSNSLNLQNIERPPESYDVVISNHVLEHVDDDRLAFREIMRILKPKGFFQFSVPSPHVRDETEEWGYPDSNRHHHYRIYGKDLVRRFEEARSGVKFLCFPGIDDVTGVQNFIYFASLDVDRLNLIGRKLGKAYQPLESVA